VKPSSRGTSSAVYAQALCKHAARLSSDKLSAL